MILTRLIKSDNERSQLIKKNIIAGIGIKGCSILSTLIIVPMTINYISSELYGIWLTLSSIVQWISFFDVGFGNGLRNKLTSAVALKHYTLGKAYVSTTYFILFIIFSVIGVVCYIISGLLNWSSILNVSQSYNLILIKVVRIILVVLCAQIVCKIIQNVVQSYQWNALGAAIEMAGNLLSLVTIFVLTKTMAPSLPNIALCFCLSPLFVLILSSVILFSTKCKYVSPNFRYIKLNLIKDIFGLGGKFFIIQISMLVIFQMINIIISRICGPEQVTVYNIAYKYLNAALMVFNIALAPMWSAFTDAYVKKDFIWMQSIKRKFNKIAFATIGLVCCMIIISPFVYKLWIGSSVNIPIWVTFVLGIYFIIYIWNSLNAILINGIGKIFIQTTISFIMMLIFLPLTIYFGTNFGLIGILIAMIVINFPKTIILGYQIKLLIHNQAKGIWEK